MQQTESELSKLETANSEKSKLSSSSSSSCQQHAGPPAVPGGPVSSVRLQSGADRRGLAAQSAGLHQHRGPQGVLQAGRAEGAGVSESGDSVSAGHGRPGHVQLPAGPHRGPITPHHHREDQSAGLLPSAVQLRLQQDQGEVT